MPEYKLFWVENRAELGNIIDVEYSIYRFRYGNMVYS
jgi:hypothetical protein